MATPKNGRTRGSQPAKPSRRVTEKVEHVVIADRGSTIREDFAMAAMQGLLANPYHAQQMDEGTRDGSLHSVAVWHADQLLAELAKEPQP